MNRLILVAILSINSLYSLAQTYAEVTPAFIYKVAVFEEIPCKEYLDSKHFKFYDREELNNSRAPSYFTTGQFVSSYSKGYSDIPPINKYTDPYLEIRKGDISGYCIFHFGEFLAKKLKAQLATNKLGESWFEGTIFCTEYKYKNYIFVLSETSQLDFKTYELHIKMLK